MMIQFILGATAVAAMVAGLFFLRFWRVTRDRFFIFFAVSFGIEGVDRAVLGLSTRSEETEPFIYLARLLAFTLILVAIADKNRKWSPATDESKAHK
jgi:uncharacterized membrane protein HdeD (DUF308 family)